MNIMSTLTILAVLQEKKAVVAPLCPRLLKARHARLGASIPSRRLSLGSSAKRNAAYCNAVRCRYKVRRTAPTALSSLRTYLGLLAGLNLIC